MGKFSDLVIIRDSREHLDRGWVFEPEDKKPNKFRVSGTETAMLDAGDYSIKGAEDLIRIERKNGFCEIFGNLTPKEHKERFEREMEKLKNIKHKYLIIEDSLSNDLLSLSIPQLYRSPPLSVVLKWILDLQIKYDIVPLFVGNAGKKTARYIFEDIAKRYL